MVPILQIGAFIAAMCTTDPKVSRNKIVRIVSDAWHPGDEIKAYEEITGKKVDVQRHPSKVRVKQGLVYPRLFDDGIFTINLSLVDNQRWPEVKTTSLRDYVAREYGKGARM